MVKEVNGTERFWYDRLRKVIALNPWWLQATSATDHWRLNQSTFSNQADNFATELFTKYMENRLLKPCEADLTAWILSKRHEAFLYYFFVMIVSFFAKINTTVLPSIHDLRLLRNLRKIWATNSIIALKSYYWSISNNVNIALRRISYWLSIVCSKCHSMHKDPSFKNSSIYNSITHLLLQCVF